MAENIAVRATSPEYAKALAFVDRVHTLDADGNGLWPPDGLTFRLLGEKAIKRVTANESDEDGDGRLLSTAAAEGKRVQDATVEAKTKKG